MKKRLLALALALVTVSVLFVMPASAERYWDVYRDYVKALDNNDEDAILSCAKRILAVYPNPSDKDAYARVLSSQHNAAKIYEKRGEFDKAAEAYGWVLKCSEGLEKLGENYADLIKTVKWLIKHNGTRPTVYAETADKSNIPYYGAKLEERAGTYHGMCDTFNSSCDNAYLLYVQFPTETVDHRTYELRERGVADGSNLLIAWNVQHEVLSELTDIASGKNDAYIKQNLEAIAQLDYNVFIRFGAEVNCWVGLPEDEAGKANFVDTFKRAFRHVSAMAKKYAPNAAMVFSPNDISHWSYEPEDFYPGDEYVDWVGMSAYNDAMALNYSLSDANDAFYCRGDYYENQITRISRIVDSFGDRKPIMISEGAYAYKSGDGVQSQKHAVEALRHFYTYVSRVYPQIKQVMYFNTTIGGMHYELFGDSGSKTNSELATLYRSLVSSNVAMEYSMGRGDFCGYTELMNIDEVMSSLNLSVYASYPTKAKTTVTYTLDGKTVKSTDSYPYSLNLNVKNMGVGAHLLKVTTSCMKTSDVQYFNVNVTSGGKVTVSEAVSVTGVTLSKSALTLTEGETATLTAAVSPSNASNKSVSYKSSKTDVVSVDGSGKLTALKEGTAVVTVTTADGGKTAECTVTVMAKKVPVYALTAMVEGGNGEILGAESSVTEGEAVTLTFVPEEGYELDKVTVNGVETAVVANVLNVKVNKDTQVIAAFKEAQPGADTETNDTETSEADTSETDTIETGTVETGTIETGTIETGTNEVDTTEPDTTESDENANAAVTADSGNSGSDEEARVPIGLIIAVVIAVLAVVIVIITAALLSGRRKR